MRELIERELDDSCRFIREGQETVPRFLLVSPEGGTVLFCPLPGPIEIRFERLNLVSRFMAATMVASFVFSTELIEPNAVTAIGVSRDFALAGIRMIDRKPLRFSPTEWLEGVDQIGDEVLSLLPAKHEELSAGQIAELESAIKAFSPSEIRKLKL